MKRVMTEFHLEGLTLKNRVVLPPMVCFGYSDETGMVTEKNIEHYRQMARGGTGLIIVEATCIAKDGRLSKNQLGLWQDEQIKGMKELVEACHGEGAKVIVQIHHAGEKRVKETEEAIFNVNNLTDAEIETLKEQYVAAAFRAEQAGFDGIELHGAHGYLLCQMASPRVNLREDNYGGTLERRLRLAKDIIEAIKVQCTDLKIIGYRMGANEPDLETGIAIARALESYGVNLLHVSSGLGGLPDPEVPEGFPGNWIVYMGSQVKAAVKIPVIGVNNIRSEEQASELVEKGHLDLVALGRPLLVDPSWCEKTEAGITPISCLNCKPCKWFKDGSQCPRVIEAARK